MKIGTEDEPFVTEPIADPFEQPEREQPAPAPVERPTPSPVPVRVPA